MEIWRDEQSLAIKDGYSTQYSLLLLLEGTDEEL